MKTIILEIDDLSADDYNSFDNEMKQQVGQEITSIITKMVFDMRVTKLKKIVDQINVDTTGNWLNPDILMEMLRIEED
jgi:hypothetical protein